MKPSEWQEQNALPLESFFDGDLHHFSDGVITHNVRMNAIMTQAFIGNNAIQTDKRTALVFREFREGYAQFTHFGFALVANGTSWAQCILVDVGGANQQNR